MVFYAVARYDEHEETNLFRAYITEEIRLAVQRKIMQISWADIISGNTGKTITAKPGSVIKSLTDAGAISIKEAGDGVA